MTVFGDQKFGTFKFGPTTQGAARFALEVDWNSDALFDGSREQQMVDMSVERGRQYTFSPNGETFEEEDTGKFSVKLIDDEYRYDPFNSASPLFGNLAGGKTFRLRVRTPEDVVYPLMAGVLDEPTSYRDGGTPMAVLAGLDGWDFLRDQSRMVTLPLQEGVYVDDAITLILAAAGWPALWGSVLDPGVDLRPYFWVDSASAAKSIHQLAFNELGTVSMAADGALRFRSRANSGTEVLTITEDDCLNNGVSRMSPKDVIRNVIKVQTSPRTQLATQVVWTLPGVLQIEPGETISDIWAEFTYNDSAVPVKNPVTPVATTDYLAASNVDGSGTNLTGSIVVTMYPFATRAQISMRNSGGTRAYVYFGQVRGDPVVAGDTTTFEYRSAESIAQFGSRPFTLTIDQNINVARQYRDLLGTFLTQARNYLKVDLMPNPAVQYAVDLGDVVRVTHSGYGINATYRVMHIKHSFRDKAGIIVNTQWMLEPYTRLFSGAQIPLEVPFQLGVA